MGLCAIVALGFFHVKDVICILVENSEEWTTNVDCGGTVMTLGGGVGAHNNKKQTEEQIQRRGIAQDGQPLPSPREY